MNDKHFPNALWSEILPGLWQGGTDDYDVVGVSSGYGATRVTRTHFDSVYTLYARANAASWNVKEIRYGFGDGDMTQPFGGTKQSGNTRDKSMECLAGYMQSKSAWFSLD